MSTMKNVVLVLASIVSVYAQETPRVDRRPAQITFRVLTDEGAPVSNVEVTTSTFLRWQPGEGFGQDIYEETNIRTNADGLATVNFTSERGDCNYGIYGTSGYYATRNLQYQFKEVKAGRWEPWNPTVDVVCKPIIKPTPMYARKIGGGSPMKIPELNIPIAFDLMVGDWVAPHGKGKMADLIFTLAELIAYTDGTKPFDYVLTVTFPNEGDGIQSVLAAQHKDSELRLPRHAPENGYEPKVEKQMAIMVEGKPMKHDLRDDQNYFFRVRTVLDEKGRIKSALYGKITGDIRFGVNRSVRFTYYLNPEPLDRNLEFDRRRNLFGHLTSLESVNEP